MAEGSGDLGTWKLSVEEAKKRWLENEEELRKEVAKNSMLDENLDECKRKVQSLEAYKERLMHQSTKEIESLQLEIKDLKRKLSEKDNEIEDQRCKVLNLLGKITTSENIIRNLEVKRERLMQQSDVELNNLRDEVIK